MTLIERLAYRALARRIAEWLAEQEGRMALKPGVSTTEFAVLLVMVALDALAVVGGMLPADLAAMLATASGAIYNVGRVVNKYTASSGAAQPDIEELMKRIEARLGTEAKS